MIENLTNLNSKERNLARVKIEGKIITIGEDQSFLNDGYTAYLIGPTGNGIDVFQELQNDTGYQARSGGYLSCIEVKGELAGGRSFLIHATESRSMSSHLKKIFSLTNNDSPLSVTIAYDKSRALPDDYVKIVKEVMGNIDVEDISN